MKIPPLNRLNVWLLALSTIFLLQSTRAATIIVQVGPAGGRSFVPDPITIHPGDTVEWDWVSGIHSATSGVPGNPDGLFDSGVHMVPFTFSHIFTTPGSVPYYCTVHGAMMVGTVNVVAVFPAQKDNTLYEDPAGQLSNGQGIYLFDGKTGTNLLRRGLIAFDLTSIPTNATITGATLSMYLSMTQGGSVAISLSKVSRDWGEGASDAGDPGGMGAPSEPGDATWIHTFYNTSFWTTSGGDFSLSPSATTTVNAVNTTYTWSGLGLTADVQAWVSNPATNFGWVIRGDEVDAGSAQRFNTRENSSNPPQLTVTYQLPSPSPTPSPTPTGTPTATPALVSISGAVTYCSNPALPPVPGVTMTLTGTSSGSVLTGPTGTYTFSSLPSGGSYTVTPSKATLASGSAGINTLDVVAAQRQFLNLGTPLTGCRLTAADASPVNGDGVVNTLDVIAIQRFFLSQTTGLGRCGKYNFTPASRTYTAITTNQTAQNYDALVFGDTAGSPFVHRPEGSGGTEPSAGEALITVAAVGLPEMAVDRSRNNFVAAIKTSEIDAKNKLVGFQGDLTFDERVVTFQSEPVSKGGLTAGNWNVSGNVLPGTGPIRTLRISAYSNDFTPLSGSGTLFNLNLSRVGPGAQSTKLIWAAPPDSFIFIDADLNPQKPGNAAPGSVSISIVGRGR